MEAIGNVLLFAAIITLALFAGVVYYAVFSAILLLIRPVKKWYTIRKMARFFIAAGHSPEDAKKRAELVYKSLKK